MKLKLVIMNNYDYNRNNLIDLFKGKAIREIYFQIWWYLDFSNFKTSNMRKKKKISNLHLSMSPAFLVNYITGKRQCTKVVVFNILFMEKWIHVTKAKLTLIFLSTMILKKYMTSLEKVIKCPSITIYRVSCLLFLSYLHQIW
jgi:hypothetical protein